jgi:hypothetical protein
VSCGPQHASVDVVYPTSSSCVPACACFWWPTTCTRRSRACNTVHRSSGTWTCMHARAEASTSTDLLVAESACPRATTARWIQERMHIVHACRTRMHRELRTWSIDFLSALSRSRRHTTLWSKRVICLPFYYISISPFSAALFNYPPIWSSTCK